MKQDDKSTPERLFQEPVKKKPLKILNPKRFKTNSNKK